MPKNATPTVSIRSPRLDHAIQEAGQKGWKKIHYRYTTDPQGRLVRLGYYFEEEGTKDKPPPVTWLQPDECTVEGESVPGSDIRLEVWYVDKDGKATKANMGAKHVTRSTEPPKD